MLNKPFLAKCDDRRVLPKEHPTSGNPDDWFHNDLISKVGLTGISFDYFINWKESSPIVTPVIWIKRFLQTEYSYDALLGNVDKAIKEEFGTNYIKVLSEFANKYSLAVQFIIFKDEQDWTSASSQICIVNLNLDNNTFEPDLINLDGFKLLIQTYSGGAVSVGTKGLIYGTSRLECTLSHTNAAYPGDMDLLVLNEQFSPVLMLEYKKDTQGGPIENQKLSNYYPSRDKRKYDRLAIFRDFLQTQVQQIPIAVVYYSTSTAITQIKIELINGEPNAVKSLASKVFNKNQTGNHEGSADLIKAIVDKYYIL
ncbi:hypothetical protein BEL04_07925 [Mucilaginibacter sp. PPCGB 2223]|nr:hypothetical protein BEL04_07925 [Mucilaginibacter sp. PPCGB 2223]